QYRKVPVIAGGVPIELVAAIGAGPHHALHAIADRVAMLARPEQAVRIADPDALEIAHALHPEYFRLPGPGHRLDSERNADLVAARALHGHRNIPVDAAPDIVALGIDVDGFQHRHRAVGMQAHIGGKSTDFLAGQG